MIWIRRCPVWFRLLVHVHACVTSQARRFVVVKDGYLFVFEDITARSPLYAFPLSGVRTEMEDRRSPSDQSYTISRGGPENLSIEDFCTVLLYTPEKKGKVAFQVTFVVKGEEGLVQRFIGVVENASNEASAVAPSIK